MPESSLLSWIVFFPLLGAAAVWATRSAEMAKCIALGATLVPLGLSLLLIPSFATSPAEYGHVLYQHRFTWIATADNSFRIEYYLGVDGISLPFIVLTTLVVALACAASWNFESWNTRGGLRGYLALLLLLETGMLGVFAALDFFLFYVFWEVMLLPMYFLIGVWGGPRREYAAIKFFLYTLAGSVLMLVAMLAFYFYPEPASRTFDLIRLATDAGSRKLFNDPQTLFLGFPFAQAMFLLLFVGFAIKIPVVPLHTWLPDAHVEAPTPISMILAGVLLKMGGYGMLRICYPMLPSAGESLAVVLGGLGVFSILYGALCAMAQTDFKRLVAYSSISHMGYALLGMASMTAAGMQGALFQMIAHGISSPMCFFLVGVIYDRVQHRDLRRMGGLWLTTPVYGSLATIGFFAAMGLPALCGFIGEVLAIFGAFDSRALSQGMPWNVLYGALAACGAILSAAYVLWMMQRVFLGPPHADFAAIADVDRRERSILAPLALLCFALGILPRQFLLDYISAPLVGLLRLSGS